MADVVLSADVDTFLRSLNKAEMRDALSLGTDYAASQFADSNLVSILPTSNPGGGKPWLLSDFLVTGDAYTPADDSAVVHTTGDEDIGGEKTFSSAVSMNSDLTLSATSSSIYFSSVSDTDRIYKVNTNTLGTDARWLTSLGSLSAPGHSFINDADTGMYSPGTNSLALVTAGVNRLHIDSSGNVGIGTSSPGGAFHIVTAENSYFMLGSTTPSFNKYNYIVGNQWASDTEPEGWALFSGFCNSSENRMMFGGGSTTANMATTIRFYTSSDITLRGGSSVNERMRIASGGNVLIGTTTDDGSNLLQVAGAATFTGNVSAANGTFSGTLGVTGNTTLTGQLTVSSQATFASAIVMSNATTNRIRTAAGSIQIRDSTDSAFANIEVLNLISSGYLRLSNTTPKVRCSGTLTIRDANDTADGSLSALNGTFSGTLGVTGAATFTADILASANNTVAVGSAANNLKTVYSKDYASYNAYTDAGNYDSRGRIWWNSNVFTLGTEAPVGTGTARHVNLISNGSTRIGFQGSRNKYYSATASGSTTSSSHLFVTSDDVTLFEILGGGGATFSSTLNIGGKFTLTKNTYDYTVDVSGTSMNISTSATQLKLTQSGATGTLLLNSVSGNTNFSFNDTIQWRMSETDFYPDTTDTHSLGKVANQLSSIYVKSFSSYNLYSSPDYERGQIAWASNVWRIGTVKGGTGVSRDVAIITDNTQRLLITGVEGNATLSPVWNAASTFTAWKVNVTDTLSNSSSLLADFQIGGTSMVKIAKSGLTTISLPGVASGLLVDYTTSVNNSGAVGLRVRDTGVTFFSVAATKGPGSVSIGYGISAGASFSSNSSATSSHVLACMPQVMTTGTSKGLALSQQIAGSGDSRGNLLDLTISGSHTGTGGRYHIVATTTSTEVFHLTDGGNLTWTPSASVTPANNGHLTVEATNDTTLTFKYKGSDGTVRSGTITLS